MTKPRHTPRKVNGFFLTYESGNLGDIVQSTEDRKFYIWVNEDIRWVPMSRTKKCPRCNGTGEVSV